MAKLKKIVFLNTKGSGYPRNLVISKLLHLGQQKNDFRLCTIPTLTENYLLNALVGFFTLIARVQLIFKKSSILFLGLYSQPLLPIISIIKKILKSEVKIIADVYISFYATLCLEKKWVKKNTFFKKCIFRWEKKALESADCLIFDTEENKKFISKAYNLHNKKSFILPIASAAELYQTKPIAKKNLSGNKFTILFYATYHKFHGIDTIIKAAKMSLTDKNIRFLFVGSGPEKKRIIAKVKKEKITNISFLDRISYSKLIELIRKADLCLGIFGSSKKADRVIANKIVDALCLKKLVITKQTKLLSRFLPPLYLIKVDKKSLSQNLYQRINYFYQKRENVKQTVALAHKTYQKFFSLQANSGKFLKLIKTL